jgi:hypothetical protein
VPERATVLSRIEKSAESVIATGVGAKGRTRRRADGHVARNYSALEARAAGATRRRGEAGSEVGLLRIVRLTVELVI